MFYVYIPMNLKPSKDYYYKPEEVLEQPGFAI